MKYIFIFLVGILLIGCNVSKDWKPGQCVQVKNSHLKGIVFENSSLNNVGYVTIRIRLLNEEDKFIIPYRYADVKEFQLAKCDE